MGSKIDRIFNIDLYGSIMLFFNRRLCVCWASDTKNSKNFGDALNPILLGKIAESQIVNSRKVININKRPTLYFIGSILDNLNRSDAIVLGAGFQNENAIIKSSPRRVLAVRGPLSRSIFLRNGVECPEVYGDPAILLPDFFNLDVHEKKWDVGIIPHYVDKGALKKADIVSDGLTYKIIDIESPVVDILEDISNSRFILSSSLHGIISAHAYNVPATWMHLSENIIGGDFKFRDYALSVGVDNIYPYFVNGVIDLRDAIEMAEIYDVNECKEKITNVVNKYIRQ